MYDDWKLADVWASNASSNWFIGSEFKLKLEVEFTFELDAEFDVKFDAKTCVEVEFEGASFSAFALTKLTFFALFEVFMFDWIQTKSHLLYKTKIIQKPLFPIQIKVKRKKCYLT